MNNTLRSSVNSSISSMNMSNIKRKLFENNIKITTLINNFERVDRNSDGIIHINDFEDILDKFVGIHILSRRDRKQLITYCNYDKTSGLINYNKLEDLLPSDDLTYNNTLSSEKWHDIIEDEDQYEPGSIGEWLKTAACPTETRNHELLITCLENYERESGMRIKTTSTGFTIPLGPDLKAHLNFTIN